MQLALLGVSVSYGMGRHHSHLTDDQVALALQWYWAELAIAIVCLGIGKASVVAFLLELQGPTHKKMRIILIAVAIVNVSEFDRLSKSKYTKDIRESLASSQSSLPCSNAILHGSCGSPNCQEHATIDGTLSRLMFSQVSSTMI